MAPPTAESAHPAAGDDSAAAGDDSAAAGDDSAADDSKAESDADALREIRDALAENWRARDGGASIAPLLGLDALGRSSKCNRYPCGLGVPIVRAAHAFTDSWSGSLVRATSDQVFACHLAAEAPWLASFDFREHGLILAGGAVSALLMHGTWPWPSDGFCGPRPYSDFDLFLIGEPTAAMAASRAARAVAALGNHLWATWGGAVDVYRTEGCVTFVRRDAPRGAPMVAQIVLQWYATAAQMLHSFDLGASAFLWDGKRVRMTALGRLAALHAANVVNLPARYPSYEARLARYHARGFDIVLIDAPLKRGKHLPATLRARAPPLQGHMTVLRLPFMAIFETRWARTDNCSRTQHVNDSNECRAIADACPTCIGAVHIIPCTPGAALPRGPRGGLRSARASAYEQHAPTYGSARRALHRNVAAIAGAKPELACAIGPYVPGLDVSSLEVAIGGDAQMLDEVLRLLGAPTPANVAALRALLGPERATAALTDWARGGAVVNWAAAAENALARIRELRELPGWRVAFAPVIVRAGGPIVGRYPRAPTSAAAWYGA